jgi:hypothetical protein
MFPRLSILSSPRAITLAAFSADLAETKLRIRLCFSRGSTDGSFDRTGAALLLDKLSIKDEIGPRFAELTDQLGLSSSVYV